MPIIGDVFSLSTVYDEQVKNVEGNNFDSWPESAIRGYYGAGRAPGNISLTTIDRLDFVTETRTTPTPKLSIARADLASGKLSSTSFGYFGGGSSPPGLARFSTIDRLDFSTDSVVTPAPKLPQANSEFGATSSGFYAYFVGGFGGSSGARISTINRLDFSTDSVVTPAPKLPAVTSGQAGTESRFYGYFSGGFGQQASVINRLDFTTETVSVPTPKLSSLGSIGIAAVSSSAFGYFGGGYLSSAINRLDFTTETVSVPTPKLPGATFYLSATGSFSYGYFGGGNRGTFPTPNPTSTINRLDFTTEIVSSPTTLSSARSGTGATSGGQSV